MIFAPLIAQAQLKKDLPGYDKEVSIYDLRPKQDYRSQNQSALNPFRQQSGLALVSSLVIPGSGQAINKKWVRAGAYFLAEATALTFHFVSLNKARKQERKYKQFANNNWSVVEYAQWLVAYHDQNSLTAEGLETLRNQVTGESPTYNPSEDWNVVDIEILRTVEENTPFVYPDNEEGNNFSHVLPDYGSQQYYELISKYYQYSAGWNDFGTNRQGQPINSLYQLNWDGSDSPMNFFLGAKKAEAFNDNYRLAGNMVSLLILNHLVSAFDAFLTVKLKNSRFDADAKLLGPESFTFRYNF
ncbi:MAG: hypothetical protein U5J95_13070 [Balneolaceae bacterium]|nr:hypothetical protein [Balneolaceae bacterium]